VGLITIPEAASLRRCGRGTGGDMHWRMVQRESNKEEPLQGWCSSNGCRWRGDAQQEGAGRGAGFTRQPGIQLADPALNPLEGARLSATLPAVSTSSLFAGSPHTLDELQALAKNGDALPSFPLA